LKIKEDVGNCWCDLGISLGIETAKLRNIEQDKSESRERAHQVLQVWRDQKGREATVGRLALALDRIGHKKIAEKVLGMLMVFCR